jgi:ferredoxin
MPLVTFENRDGDAIEVRTGRSILDAARDAGIALPSACGVGVCTTCVARVLDGEVAAADGELSPSARRRGFVLLCMATPLGDCRLQVGSAAVEALAAG